MMVTRSFTDGYRRTPGSDDLGTDARPTANVFELARRPVLRIGAALVDPATRTVTGPGGAMTLEPRVMQVLLLLADAGGQVVTRDDFIAQCWNGQIVGDDSLNRAIGEARRVARATAADSFAIETIPKTGYRLAVAQALEAEPRPQIPEPTASPFSRRALVVGASTAVVLAGGAGGAGWWATARRRDPRVAELMAQGEQALREAMPESERQGVGFLKEAVARAPEDAGAWGLLALALCMAAEHSPPDKLENAVAACETAARRSLALDPRQSNALAALAMLVPFYGDWLTAERRLRDVIAIDSANVAAIGQLGLIMQAVGRVSDALTLTTQAAELEPLSPTYQYRRTYQLWSNGALDAADQVIDRALQLWPAHPAIWYARMLVFAMTSRPAAALRMIEADVNKPYGFPERYAVVWRKTLAALISGDARTRSIAVAATMAVVTASPVTAVNGILCLCRLGAIDEAFVVAEGFLRRRGPAMGNVHTEGSVPTAEQRWRKTQMLFVPATAPMRADPRFGGLVANIGMAGYWRAAGVTPDYKKTRA